MRTGEIIDLSNERRLSAVLDFTHAGAELLILNGGSRAEEFSIEKLNRNRARKERRNAYCIDSGTSMLLTVPLAPGESPRDVTLRVTGGHGEMLLSAPDLKRVRRLPAVRGWASLAAATVLLMLAGGHLDSPGVVASADPEPAPAEAPLVKARVSLGVPAPLPSVVAAAVDAKSVPAALRHRPVVAHVPSHAERRVALADVAPTKRTVPPVDTPAPRMTDLHVPVTAKAGDFVPVSFGAVGHQVKIVASIGPTIVSKTIVTAQRGVVAIRSPKSDLDSRVMTVRAYAEDGHRSSWLQAMVVLVHP
jgi:hypothetical protein